MERFWPRSCNQKCHDDQCAKYHLYHAERGMIDEFTVTTRNIKDMQRIVIGHDNCYPGADWHLKLVSIP